MAGKLDWTVDQAGFIACVLEDGRFVPWGEWARREILAGSRRVELGPLVARLEAAGLDPTLTEMTLPHETIAGLPTPRSPTSAYRRGYVTPSRCEQRETWEPVIFEHPWLSSMVRAASPSRGWEGKSPSALGDSCSRCHSCAFWKR